MSSQPSNPDGDASGAATDGCHTAADPAPEVDAGALFATCAPTNRVCSYLVSAAHKAWHTPSQTTEWGDKRSVLQTALADLPRALQRAPKGYTIGWPTKQEV